MNLTDYFYLKRAGRFTNPLDSNARLPIVYGDITDGTSGNWQLPCIDTVNFVYCFAAHSVQAVPDGNSINIYSNDILVSPSLYTFSPSHPGYENMATVIFTTDRSNEIISARGKGKATAGILMENIIDQIYDFLTIENPWTSSLFEPTLKEKAKSIFTAQGYKAAGVINEDRPIWDLIQEMIGSFYGSAYLNGLNLLVLDIDNGLLTQYGMAGILRRSEVKIISAIQKAENLINQCPISYAYNYLVMDFRSHTDEIAHADLISQGIYGVQEPASPYRCYWCRDLASVQAIQDVIVGKFKNPVWELELEDSTLKRCRMDVGDIAVSWLDCLYDRIGSQLANQYIKIIGVSPSFTEGTIRFRALDTGYYMTASRIFDGSWTFGGESA